MEIFERPTTIFEPVGNNRFWQSDPSSPLPLDVPRRIRGTLDDVRISDRTAFREFGSDGKLIEEPGLEHFVSTDWNGIPLHVVDNHNYALAFWLEALAEGVIDPWFVIAHADMHSDLWPNPNVLETARISDPSYVEDFVNFRTEVGNYVEPALRSGLVNRFVRMEGETDLIREYELIASGKYDGSPIVLNLDLDFFAPDLDDVPFELKRSVVLAFAEKARLITVATSPVFIEQERALRYLRMLFG